MGTIIEGTSGNLLSGLISQFCLDGNFNDNKGGLPLTATSGVEFVLDKNNTNKCVSMGYGESIITEEYSLDNSYGYSISVWFYYEGNTSKSIYTVYNYDYSHNYISTIYVYIPDGISQDVCIVANSSSQIIGKAQVGWNNLIIESEFTGMLENPHSYLNGIKIDNTGFKLVSSKEFIKIEFANFQYGDYEKIDEVRVYDRRIGYINASDIFNMGVNYPISSGINGTPNEGISGTLVNGLMAHWCFNNGSLLDISNNSRNLIQYGNPTKVLDKNGVTDSAYDGMNSSNFFGITDGFLNSTDFTISLWSNNKSITSGYHDLFTTQPYRYNDTYYGIAIHRNGDKIYYGTNSNIKGLTVPYGWYNLTLTFDNITKTFRAYINGTFMSTKIINISNISNFLQIGGGFNNSGETSIIDEIRIYNRILSDSEISEIHNMDVNYTSSIKTENPSIYPNSGIYIENIMVSILSPSSNKDTTVYYTLDGTEPNYGSNSFFNSVELYIDKTTTIKAFAEKDDCIKSDTITEIYTIKPVDKIVEDSLFFKLDSNIMSSIESIKSTDYTIPYNAEFNNYISPFDNNKYLKQYMGSYSETRFESLVINENINISFFSKNIVGTTIVLNGIENEYIKFVFDHTPYIEVNGSIYTQEKSLNTNLWTFYSIDIVGRFINIYIVELNDPLYVDKLEIPEISLIMDSSISSTFRIATIETNNELTSMYKYLSLNAQSMDKSQRKVYYLREFYKLYNNIESTNFVRVYIGEINSTLSSREFIDITEYIEDEFITTLPYVDEIPTLSNLNFYLPTENCEIYPSLSTELKRLISNKDFIKFPVLIKDDNKVIFNGIFDTVDMEYIKGINPEYIRYKCTAKHKSSELDYIQINRKVSNIGNKIDLFLKELIETNTKINKFKYKTSTTNVINSTSLNYIDLDVYGKSSDNSIRVGDVLYVKNSGIIQSGFPKVIKKIDKIVSNMVSCTSAILDNYNENDAYSDSSGKYFTIVNSGLYNMLYLKNKNGIIIAKGIAENNGTTNSAELSPINIYKTKLNITFTDINELDTEKKIYIEKLRVSFFDNIGYTVFNEMFIGYDIVSEVVNEFKIYEPQIKFETLYYTLNRISEKYYINYTINDFCSIKLFDTAYIEDSETLIINNNRVIDELGISTQGGELMNSLYISDFKESEYVETLEPINKMINKYNIFHKTDKEVSNTSDSINIDNGSPDNYDTNGYVYLGNNENSHIYTEIFVGNLDISNIFLKNIIIPVSRSNFVGNVSMYAEIINNNQTIYNSIIPESNIDANLTIPTIFFNIKNTSKLGIYFTYKTSTKINSISEYGLNRYIIQFDSSNQDLTDCIGTSHDSIILSDGTYSFRLKVIQSTAPNTYICSIEYEYPTFNFTLSNFVNTYIYTEKLGEIDELIEFKMTNMQNSEYFETIKNIHGHTLVKSYDFQNSYMVYYPCKKLGANFNGEYEIAYPQYIEGISTNILKYEPNVLNDYTFSPLLDIDLVYIQIYDNDLDTWNTFKVKSFNKVTGELTLWDSVVLKSGYEIDNSLSKMLVRRVINTTDINSGEKPSNDTYYEGYIFKERGAYGFNTTVESNLIKYINGDTSVIDKCYPYIVGEIIGCYYNTEIPRVKYDNNIDSIDKYGYLEEVQSSNFVNVEDYNIYSRTELLTRAFPLKSGNIKLKYNLLNSDKLKKYIKIEGSICDNNEYFLVNKYEQIYNLSISKSDIYKLNAIIEEVV